MSTSLRELEDYRLVYRQSVPGDRRSYFTAETDVWEMARRILEERRRRETEGAVSAVQECLASAKWVARQAGTLGKTYASELSRRR